MLRSVVAIILIGYPFFISAHNLVCNQLVPKVNIIDRGELFFDNSELSYKRWDSSKFSGKVRVVQYIAGRTSAKEKNSMLITAIKNVDFPQDRFQPTTIINTDDAIPGSGFFVRSKIEKNKRHYPWAQFIVDSDGLARKAWGLPEKSSTIIVLDKNGHVKWAKDGALSPAEVDYVLNLLVQLIAKDK